MTTLRPASDPSLEAPSQDMAAAGDPTHGSNARIWVAVIASTLGAFMAVLNIQIVNASLADIQGAIGAGLDDGGWISTAYLIAEIVVIPLTGWLARVFSVRRYLIVNAVLFLVFSVACAFARDLGQMIVLRAIQGFTGGVLIPMAFTIIITFLPKDRQPIGLALFAISATFAPAIGPTIGGYLTENWGWQYIFYVNLVPGILMVVMLWFSLDRAADEAVAAEDQATGPESPPWRSGSPACRRCWRKATRTTGSARPSSCACRSSQQSRSSLFVWIELTTKSPLLNLHLLLRRNFGFGLIANFMLGVALYGSVFIMPLYLDRTQGYNSEQIGLVLAWTGLPQLVLIPLVPRMMKRFDVRALIVIGFALFAVSNFMNIHMTADYASDQLLWPNIVRAVGQALVFAPLSAVAAAGIEKENAGSASSLFNMTRNLGGAVGIAVLQTFLTKREQFHSNVLVQSVSLFAEATRQRIAHLTAYFLSHGLADKAAATHKAVVAIGLRVRQQATIMAFSDTFFLIGLSLIVALLASLLLTKPAKLSGAAAH